MFYRRSKLDSFNENSISSIVDFIYNIDPNNYQQMLEINEWLMDNWFQVDLGIGVATQDKEKLNPIFRALAEVFPCDAPDKVYRGRIYKGLQRKFSEFLFGVSSKDCRNIGNYRGLLYQAYLKKFKGDEEATIHFLNNSKKIPLPKALILHPYIQTEIKKIAYGTRSWTTDKETAIIWGWGRGQDLHVDSFVFVYKNPKNEDVLFPVDTYVEDYEAIAEYGEGGSGDEVPGFDWGEVVMSIKDPIIKNITLYPNFSECRYEVEIG